MVGSRSGLTPGNVSTSLRARFRGLGAAHMPGYQVDSVVRIGEGTDNIVYELNYELIVRFSKDSDPARRAEAARIYAAIAEQLPAAYRRPVEVFLDSLPPDGGYALAFSHNDLGIEHILVDPGALMITGIIDWTDAAIVDPASDFGLLYRDLGPAALEAAIGSYRSDVTDVLELRRRAVFYAKCRVFEDLAYGLETGQRRYFDKSITALEWLFPV